MKSLDQTIDELTAFYSGLDLPEGDEPLLYCALCYLKEYRARDRFSRRIDLEDNEPLTREQLQNMEGKPVWIEFDDHKAGRRRTQFKCWEVADACFDDVFLVRSNWSYKWIEQGDIWQAYRKERK